MDLEKALAEINLAILRENLPFASEIQSEILAVHYDNLPLTQQMQVDTAFSELSLKRCNYPEALEWAIKAHSKLIHSQIQDHGIQSSILFILGMAEYHCGNIIAAKVALSEALKIYDSVYGTISEPSIFTRVHLAELLLSNRKGNDYEEILTDVMKHFVSFLYYNRGKLSSAERFSFMKRLYPPYTQIMRMLAVSDLSPKLLKEALDFRLNTKSIILENNFNAKYSDQTFTHLQALLKPNEAIVEIVRQVSIDFDNTERIRYLFFIISNDSIDGPSIHNIDFTPHNESELLVAYHKNIKAGAVDLTSYDSLWMPLQKVLHDYSTIYISPDGLYRHINFQSLQNDDGEYLSDTYQIRYCDDIRNICYYTEDKVGLPKKALVCANPVYYSSSLLDADDSIRSFLPSLHYTQLEAESVSDTLLLNAIDTKLVTGEALSKPAFDNMEEYELLHVATHGYYKKTPQSTERLEELLLSSGLFLSQPFVVTPKGVIQVNRDGFLTVDNIRNLNTRNLKLVALSACNSGQGKFINLGDFFGIQRAFFIAGAKFVISSLWEVSDSYALDFMNHFYQLWMDEQDIQQAFDRAQAQMKVKYSDPRKWACFVLYHR